LWDFKILCRARNPPSHSFSFIFDVVSSSVSVCT
jgi:hypothetical protein